MSFTLILSVGEDRTLLGTRNLVLESAGHTVVAAASIREAANLFTGGDFDIVVLCHSIPAKQRERLTCLIRASGSRIPIVSVSGEDCEYDHFLDATLADEPVKFLAGVKDVLLKHARMWSARMSPQENGRVTITSEKEMPMFDAGPQQPQRAVPAERKSFPLLAISGRHAFSA